MNYTTSKRVTYKKFEENLAKKHSVLSIIFIYSFVLAVTTIVFTFFIPLLMTYAPDVINFVNTYSVNIIIQIAGMLILAIIIGGIVLKILLKDFNKWELLANNSDIESQNRIRRIRKKCITYPYIIYMIQVFVTVIIVAIVFLFISISNQTDTIVVLKLTIILFSLFSVVGILSLIFSKRIFSIILLNTYKNEEREGIRINIKNRILLQTIPLIVVAILITSLIGFGRLVEERGENLFKYYKAILNKQFEVIETPISVKYLEDTLNRVNEVEDTTYFILKPNGEYITSDNEEPALFFTLNIEVYSEKRDGRVYDEMSLYNGVVKKINSEEGIWKVGLKYKVTPNSIIQYFIYNLIIMIILCFFILYYTSKAISSDISVIAQKLLILAEGDEVDLDFKLPVISNDEIADLTIAFNKIQEREKMHVENIKSTNEIMMEKERFVSLGHLIGGIAHNMRTPIMSISGAMIGLNKLIDEYKSSVNSTNVTKEDHLEIADEMKLWVKKVIPYCTYMSDILTAVKEQTAISIENIDMYFKIDDMAKSVEILMEQELKMSRCKLNLNINIDLNSHIKGNLSDMVQIISNLILNSIQSYENKKGEIDFIINEYEGQAEIRIKDFGAGIPEDIKEKLFKQMVTTKGKRGTGLGLYMINSSIKANFKGKIWYESEQNKGTTFYILVPLLK